MFGTKKIGGLSQVFCKTYLFFNTKRKIVIPYGPTKLGPNLLFEVLD